MLKSGKGRTVSTLAKRTLIRHARIHAHSLTCITRNMNTHIHICISELKRHRTTDDDDDDADECMLWITYSNNNKKLDCDGRHGRSSVYVYACV